MLYAILTATCGILLAAVALNVLAALYVLRGPIWWWWKLTAVICSVIIIGQIALDALVIWQWLNPAP